MADDPSKLLLRSLLLNRKGDLANAGLYGYLLPIQVTIQHADQEQEANSNCSTEGLRYVHAFTSMLVYHPTVFPEQDMEYLESPSFAAFSVHRGPSSRAFPPDRVAKEKRKVKVPSSCMVKLLRKETLW